MHSSVEKKIYLKKKNLFEGGEKSEGFASDFRKLAFCQAALSRLPVVA